MHLSVTSVEPDAGEMSAGEPPRAGGRNGAIVPFADELRIRRVELNISQAELATQLGVSQQTISRWETVGTVAPGPRRIAALAAALRLDLAALLRSAGYLNDVDVETRAEALATQVGRMTTSELVLLVDAAWQQLRQRLSGVTPWNPFRV
jgi:transcriptional regulator with XRE-family HTH domain